MKKSIATTLIVAAVLSLSLSSTVLAASPAPKSCTDAYTSSIKIANNAHVLAVKAADGVYKNAVAAAKTMTDKKAKAAALKTVLAAKTSAVNEASKTLKTAKNSANATLKECQNFRITTTSLPAWISGELANYTMKATGGSLPLIWTVKSGSLPEGFTLSGSGIISGSYILPPSVTKKIFSAFTMEAKDQKGQTRESVKLSITVKSGPPKITTTNPSDLTVGQSSDQIIATAIGGIPPYKFYREASSGPMPFGMQITTSGSSAHLVGSPKAKGNFSFRVCVKDSTKTEKCGDVAFKVQEKQIAPTSETWQGTITTSGRCECSSTSHGCDSYGNGGELTGSFTFTFTIPGSLIQALKSSGPYEPGNPGPGKGTFNGSETVATQSNRNDCQLGGGSAANIPIVVIGRSSTYYPGYIALVSFDASDNPEGQRGLLSGGWITSGGGAPGGQISGMSLLISSISDTQMSGKVSFTDPGTGIFTLTKVK